MVIKTAEFVCGYTDVRKCPRRIIPEFAFVGRSNVGKSSLINYLCGRKKLSKVSSKPGKTRQINFFLINDQFHLVDLPGYGYARVSATEREWLDGLIRSYVTGRAQLMYVLLLIDSRILPQQIDLEFADWLGENEIPFVIVFTKADKPQSHECLANIQAFRDSMMRNWEELPAMFITSALHNIGREELLKWLSCQVKDFSRLSAEARKT
ncbi:MAG: ribosome biogenesis GTP-binding protein YihA/YsxC [Chitinophagales bacterium]|nr:ribosome biogenesis GTP-binding protein YihA/YsxC [Chitinophagales bacterium]MDW8418900.1 ribosome biogenesis GTP-binding protein YihA/YsxC [Chitinophagales bacterium]